MNEQKKEQIKNSVTLNPLERLDKKLQENASALKIARVPIKTKREFIRIANEEFCGDYGMYLKFLIDDIPTQDTRIILEHLKDIEIRLLNLESKPEEEPKIKTRKMLDGSERRLNRQ